MVQPAKPYDHVILIDVNKKDLAHLKQELILLNYAMHISCFENTQIASQYIKHCKKIPELIFINITEQEDLKIVDIFQKEFFHLTRVVITSSFKKLIDQEKIAILPNIIHFLLKPIKALDLNRNIQLGR